MFCNAVWRRLGLAALLPLLWPYGAQAQTRPSLPAGVEAEWDIAYAAHPETRLDVYRPAGAAKRRPAVIVIHGGGWRGGTKEAVVPSFCVPYLEKGFVVFNVEYRLAKAAKAPAAVEDSIEAAQWVFKNAGRYGVDKKKIIVTGGSAGGHLALMVGMTPKSAKLGKTPDVAAVVNFYGITDVGDQLAGPNQRAYAVEWLPEQEGRFELARRVSPMSYVRKGLPPVQTVHGDSDKTVPYEHGAKLTKALREAGADAELLTVPGGGHGFPPEKLKTIYPEVFAFLARRGIVGN
ncbi:MAG: alpha/beta hydrolase [Bryobacteraceae bacterium]